MLIRLFLKGARDLVRQPVSFALAVTAVAATVAIGGLFALALQTVDAALDAGQVRLQFQVYWRAGADPELVARQWAWMRALPHVAELRTFTPAQALDIMRQSLGGQADLDGLRGKNPLPYTALVCFGPGGSDPDFARLVHSRLETMEGVAEVRFDPPRMDLLQAVSLARRRLVWPMAGLLAFLVALVVGNTVRLAFARRRDEVEIMRLVGAREWTIRLPLVSGAAMLGGLGALVGLGGLKLAQTAMAEALNVPPLWLGIEFLPPQTSLAFVAAATLVAAAAGGLAARG